MSRGSPRGGEGELDEGGRGRATFACKCSFVPFCGDQLSREIGSLLPLSSFPLSLSSFATNERRASERAGNGNKKGRLERDALPRLLHDDEELDEEWKSCLLSLSPSAYL